MFADAVRFNRDGGRVTLGCQTAGADRLRMSVGDTAPGIPDAEQALLFSPFERLGADKSGVEGTGPGLALAKGLVEAMGGVIGIGSTPGQGSVFCVELAGVEAPSARSAGQPGRPLPPEEGPGWPAP